MLIFPNDAKKEGRCLGNAPEKGLSLLGCYI
jgi:hypothetical protein